MKIAVFHSFLDNIGGAEIVALTLAQELNADLYTTNISEEKISKMGFADVIPRIKSIGTVPINAPFRQQLTFLRFRKLNLNKLYDHYIIAGDWAMSGAVNNHPNTWYVHSPINELWEFKNYIKTNLLPFWQRPIFDIWSYINRKLSLHYSKKIDNFVANSINTKQRLSKYYDKESMVINPPINTKKYHYSGDNNYWLSVNRLFKNKRVEMQVKAFNKMPDKKLIIVGSFEKGSKNFEKYKSNINAMVSENIKLLSWISDEDLIDLYSNCTGFITTSRDEDFGMTAIEAMASGKPVIAPNEGGYKETIVNNVNGILIDKIDQTKLEESVKKIEQDLKLDKFKYRDTNIDTAQKYDTKRYIESIWKIIKKEE